MPVHTLCCQANPNSTIVNVTVAHQRKNLQFACLNALWTTTPMQNVLKGNCSFRKYRWNLFKWQPSQTNGFSARTFCKNMKNLRQYPSWCIRRSLYRSHYAHTAPIRDSERKMTPIHLLLFAKLWMIFGGDKRDQMESGILVTPCWFFSNFAPSCITNWFWLFPNATLSPFRLKISVIGFFPPVSKIWKM